jgi:fructose-specific component phosphotransferase system IIB-like protein
LTDWKDPNTIDTLAAAHAQAGDFHSAVEWQEKAIDLAAKHPRTSHMRMRLTGYIEGKPCRETLDKQTSDDARQSPVEDEEAQIAATLAGLPDKERRLVEAQRFCPVMEHNRLGSMGVPVKVTINGKTVFLCCEGCRKSALANPTQTFEKAVRLNSKARRSGAAPLPGEASSSVAQDERAIESEIAKLSPVDRTAAETQRFCVLMTENRLGSMGKPVKLVINGRTVFVCCDGCAAKALADPQKTLSVLDELQGRTGDQPLGDLNESASEQQELTSSEEDDIAAALGELSDDDRALAIAQEFCAVLGRNRLGSMGPPIKVVIDGQPVFLCCAHCKKKALAHPETTLAKAAELRRRAHKR